MSDRGDEQANLEFMQLYSRYQPAVFGYIYSLLPNWAEAEDVLQRTSLILWQKFGEFQPGTDFPRWACTVARYTVLKRLRERSRERLVFSDDVLELLAQDGLEDLDTLGELRQALSTCLNRTPRDQRQLLEDYYSRHATVAQLAARIGQTVAAVYKRLSRTRAALLRCIEAQTAAEGMS